MLQGLLRPFIRASLIYVVVGFSMGLCMIVKPEWAGHLRYSHMHVNLLGAYGMLIFGVAYHVLPRFAGRMLYSEWLGHIHFWVANAGLIGLVVLFPLQTATDSSLIRVGLTLSAFLQLSSALMFVFNVWKTVFSPEAKPRSGTKCKSPSLPVING